MRTTDSSCSKRGFTLVLALFLMAFVLMIMLTTAVLIQVEIASSRLVLDQLRARESARVALRVAVGELQKHAGPDRRVTARADILGNEFADSNPYWTGVWDTSDVASEPYWLVSWEDQTQPVPLETIRIVGSGSVSTPDEYVSVPSVQIDNPGKVFIEKIGWWISGEATKASIKLIDNSNKLADKFFTQYASSGLSVKEQRQLHKQLSPRRYRTELVHGNDTNFIPDKVEDVEDPNVSDVIEKALAGLEKTTTLNQLPMIKGISGDEVRKGFHDLTSMSRAVLANTDAGGLKIDLADRSFTSADTGLRITKAVSDFLWVSQPDENGNIPLNGISESDLKDLAAGDAILTTPPIITEFALFFTVSGQRKNSSVARAFLRLELEVWSPYGFRHQFDGASDSDTPELFVEFESLPKIALSYYDKDTGLYTDSTTLDFSSISPTFSVDLSETHKAGEIRRVVADWPVNAGSDKSDFYYTDIWSWEVTDPSYNSKHRKISFPEGDSISYSSSSSFISMIVKNASGDILQKITDIPIGAIATDFAFYEDTPSGLGSGDAPIVFSYKMKDTRLNLEKWLTEVDPRSIELNLKNFSVFDLVDINDINGDEKGDADIPTTYFSNLDFLHGAPNNNFFRIFDLPATIPHSLGILQHIQIKDTRPFSIGNSWGNELNAIFDRYFISGIPSNTQSDSWDSTATMEAFVFPNPFIEASQTSGKSLKLSDVNHYQSAKYLMNRGAFNVNSTSVQAWSSVLGGNSIFAWDYYVNKGTSSETTGRRLNLESAFFRLPNSGHSRSEAFSAWKFPFEAYEDEMTLEGDYPLLENSEKESIFRNPNPYSPNLDWRPSLSIGHREIDASEIQELASKIVENLQLEAKPFVSMKAFINSGIIQKSIDETSINTIESGLSYKDAADEQRIPLNATSFLSQADIISTLSPGMTTRSDTFRVRATAEIENTLTGSKTSMTCEAIVQRMPELIDPSMGIIMEDAEGLGRKFSIVNIKWLDSSQL